MKVDPIEACGHLGVLMTYLSTQPFLNVSAPPGSSVRTGVVSSDPKRTKSTFESQEAPALHPVKTVSS